MKIYMVGNRVFRIFFEDEDDAERCASNFPATSGVVVESCDVFKKGCLTDVEKENNDVF